MSLILLAVATLSSAVGLSALVRLRRRLELVARAEHELRGAATALELACRRMRREASGARHAAVVEAQLERLRSGLAELAAARTGCPPAADPRPAEPGSTGFDWVGGPAPASLDRGDLARVLGNLMANAAEHGAGEIRVNGRTTPEAVRIEIRNANRVGARRAGPERGRGLGIAERAARELGGRILVEVGERETVAVLELPRRAGGDEGVAA
jgi:signal transduction histidine kinase